MIAADTSVLVPAFAGWHERHEAALAALSGEERLIAHCALEVYSVLTRLAPPQRAHPGLVGAWLAQQFPDPPLVLGAEAHRRFTEQLPRRGISGGAVYDALVAWTAADAGATLVSDDRRALRTYERCGVDVRMLGL